MNDEKQSLSATKQHFELLDGLRGVAALAVVIFHFMEWIFPDGSSNFIGHGFLAVDFFFCLSGFVTAYAYDNRIRTMGLKAFFTVRLIRLHPLVLLGAVMGLLSFLLDPFALPVHYSAGKLALLFVSTAMLIPMPAMEDRAFNLFGLNAPSWSLFWEYIANIVYAFLLCRLNRRIIAALTLLAAIGLCLTSYRAGNLLGGWSGPTFWDGGARVAYSFLAGMLLHRSGWIIKNKMGFPFLALLLFATFLLPWSQREWLSEVVIVTIWFPLIVALGAGSKTTGRWQTVCRFSGNISYPLYMTHYAALWIFGNYLTNRKPPMSQLPWIVIPSILFLVFFAWLLMRLYDIPLRRFLRSKSQSLMADR